MAQRNGIPNFFLITAFEDPEQLHRDLCSIYNLNGLKDFLLRALPRSCEVYRNNHF